MTTANPPFPYTSSNTQVVNLGTAFDIHATRPLICDRPRRVQGDDKAVYRSQAGSLVGGYRRTCLTPCKYWALGKIQDYSAHFDRPTSRDARAVLPFVPATVPQVFGLAVGKVAAAY